MVVAGVQSLWNGFQRSPCLHIHAFGQSAPPFPPLLFTPSIFTASSMQPPLKTLNTDCITHSNQFLTVSVITRNTIVPSNPHLLSDFYLLIPKPFHCALWILQFIIRKISQIFYCFCEYSLLLIPGSSLKTGLPLQLSQSEAVFSFTPLILLGLEVVKVVLLHIVSSNLIHPSL